MPPKKKKAEPSKRASKKKVIEPQVVDEGTEELVPTWEPPEAETSKDLVSSDPLQKYLAEIRRYPLLDPKEEYALAVRVQEKGDKLAAEKLVTSNLRFVVKIAAEYSRFGAKMIDLIQEGNVGLMHAVKEFNPYKGVRLITYAVWWIRGYIQEYLMKNYSQVKIGTTQAQKKLFYHLNKEKARLDALGERPDPKLLSQKLGVSEEEVLEMTQRLSGHDLSLDAPMGKFTEESRSRTYLENQVDAQTAMPDDALTAQEEQAIFKGEIKKIIKTLNDKEKYLLQNRILGDPPLTLQEVGDYFGITRERARQLEERVIAKMREQLQKAFPDYQIKTPAED